MLQELWNQNHYRGQMKFNASNAHWHEPKRRCPDCRKRKPLDQFYRHRSRPNGRSTYCKVCNDLRTHSARRISLVAVRTRKPRRHDWFCDPQFVRGYLQNFPSVSEASKESGVSATTIYQILSGRAQITEATEDKILTAALRREAIAA